MGGAKEKRKLERAAKRLLARRVLDGNEPQDNQASVVFEMASQTANDESTISEEREVKAPWRKLASHTAIAIFFGAVLSYSGQYDLSVRSVCLLVLFFWLMFDSWKHLWQWKRGVRGVLTIGLLTFCFVLLFGGAAYFIRASEINGQQNKVTDGLTVSEDHQSVPDDPFSTTFNVWNNSPTKILKSRVSCTPRIRFGKGFVAPPEELMDGYRTYNAPLTSGDQETFVCNPKTKWGLPMECSDVTITISYWTEIKPDVELKKSVRYLSRMEKDGVHFYRESISNPVSLCFPNN
jgi:hypothetical protein